MPFRRGEVVEIRGLAEIRATLDAAGRLDGLPFMPEMERFAGRAARVWGRADRVCVEGADTMRRVPDAVFLEDLRCDGAAHDGCERSCLLLWKEAWLKPRSRAAIPPSPAALPAKEVSQLATSQTGCQSTELLAASTPLAAWRPGQYLRDLATGNLTPAELAYAFVSTLGYKLDDLRGRGARAKRPESTPTETLGLRPGDWVEVKTLAEIEATLDPSQRNRGLEFSPGMWRYCGRRFRVERRLERMIAEDTGELREIRDTVLLRGLFCDGACSRGCPRANPLYWREIWLRKIPPPEEK